MTRCRYLVGTSTDDLTNGSCEKEHKIGVFCLDDNNVCDEFEYASVASEFLRGIYNEVVE